jgi:WD40 repeat protein
MWIRLGNLRSRGITEVVQQPAGQDGAGYAPPRPVPAENIEVGHWIQSIAFSPNSASIAVGIRHGLRLLDVQTGDVLWRKRLGGWFTVTASMSFSTDGSRLAAAYEQRHARVWDVHSGQEVLRLDHGGRMQSVVFSPDGRRIATASEWTARIWDAQTGSQQLCIQSEGPMHVVAFSPDGRRLGTGEWENSARVWDSATGARLLKLGHPGQVLSLAFSPDGQRLVTGGTDRTIRMWDAVSGVEILRLEQAGPVRSLTFSPDSRRFAAVSESSVGIFSVTGEPLDRVQHDAAANAAQFSPGGEYLASGGIGKSVQIRLMR